MTQKNSKVKIYLTEFRVQGENTIYEGPNIFASSAGNSRKYSGTDGSYCSWGITRYNFSLR